jgi:hypothetical protein
MDDEARIRAVLEHIRKGAGLENFPGTRSEKLAVVARADRDRLVEWSKTRGCYRLTLAGRWKLVDKTGLASRLSAPAIAVTAAVALGFWFSADASRLLTGGQTQARANHAQATTPKQAVPARAAFPDSRPGAGPVAATEPRDLAEQPSTVPATASAEPVQRETPAVKSVGQHDPKPVTRAKRKVAKSRHKGTPTHGTSNPAFAFQYPGQFRQPAPFSSGSFSSGGRSTWSYFR